MPVPTLPVNAYESPDHLLTFHAAGDLSALQFRAMGIPDADNRIDKTGAGAKMLGILQNKPAAIDRAATVMLSGVSFAIAAAAITSGAKLMVDADGKVLTATATNHVVGVALQTVTADGNYVSILIDPQGILAS